MKKKPVRCNQREIPLHESGTTFLIRGESFDAGKGTAKSLLPAWYAVVKESSWSAI